MPTTCGGYLPSGVACNHLAFPSASSCADGCLPTFQFAPAPCHAPAVARRAQRTDAVLPSLGRARPAGAPWAGCTASAASSWSSSPSRTCCPRRRATASPPSSTTSCGCRTPATSPCAPRALWCAGGSGSAGAKGVQHAETQGPVCMLPQQIAAGEQTGMQMARSDGTRRVLPPTRSMSCAAAPPGLTCGPHTSLAISSCRSGRRALPPSSCTTRSPKWGGVGWGKQGHGGGGWGRQVVVRASRVAGGPPRPPGRCGKHSLPHCALPPPCLVRP